MDLLGARRKATAATSKIISGIRDDQWTNDTPCDDWDVRAVVYHLVNENLWVPDLVEGKSIADVGDAYEGDHILGDDPRKAFARTAAKADEAFEQAGALERPIAVSYGPVPGEVYGGHHFLDIVIHGWDIAVGTEQDTTIEPDIVEYLTGLIEPQLAMLQASGAFKVVPIPDAPPQARLLAMVGRQP